MTAITDILRAVQAANANAEEEYVDRAQRELQLQAMLATSACEEGRTLIRRALAELKNRDEVTYE